MKPLEAIVSLSRLKYEALQIKHDREVPLLESEKKNVDEFIFEIDDQLETIKTQNPLWSKPETNND